MRALYLVAPQETRDTMDRRRRVHIFFSQITENLHVQRPMMPLVAFVQVECDLHRHGIWHFTRLPPIPAATSRTALNPRTPPTCAHARAGSPPASCRFYSEPARTQGSVQNATRKSCASRALQIRTSAVPAPPRWHNPCPSTEHQASSPVPPADALDRCATRSRQSAAHPLLS